MKKKSPHANCGESPCWECHNEFMVAISPLLKAMSKLYVTLKKTDQKRCNHRAKVTPLGLVCMKCGRFV